MIIIFVLFVFLFAVIPNTLAHEWIRADGTIADASWIMENYPECCGEQDCEPVPGRVKLTDGRWVVYGLEGSLPI